MRGRWAPGVLAVAAVALSAAATPSPASVSGTARGLAPAPRPPASAAPAARQARPGFPHVQHEGLFPFCTGCHEGVPSGDTDAFYPEASFCDGCHDGAELEEVDWTPPEPYSTVDNLSFNHAEHIREVAREGDEALTCGRCHAPAGASRMTVEPLEAGRCLSCHGHPADEHVVDADCSRCHLPLSRTQLPPERIASMESPPSHGQPGFVLELHGREAGDGTARCATCHTRDTCTSCHVGGAGDVIGSIEPAPPGMQLPPLAVSYPKPPSHDDPDFEMEHGDLVVEGGDACITCHTRDDCTSCHLPPLPAGAGSLPSRSAVEAPGVVLDQEAPTSHRSPWFGTDHGVLAAADEDACASCHTEPFCASCHEAPERPAFHPADYLSRHAADAFGGMSECANCHQVQASCRACHAQAGLTQTGRLGSGYHDAEPLWLLRHPQAARQSLESCASCHTQRECLQCHSEVGSFQVSPHGPDFDPERAQSRNPGICRTCHIGDPLGGGGGGS